MFRLQFQLSYSVFAYGYCTEQHAQLSHGGWTIMLLPYFLFYSSNSVNDSYPRPMLPAGSIDEAFYDTQAWLASDDEDDFYSVHGGRSFLIILVFVLHKIYLLSRIL